MSAHLESELLSAYLDEELRDNEQRRVQVHLESCDHCQQRLDGLRRVVARLHSVGAAAVPPFLPSTLPQRISLQERPESLLDRVEARLGRMYVPKASIPLIFALVVTLAAVVYVFAWSVHRAQTPQDVGAASGEGVVPRGAPVELGDRTFEFVGDGWRQIGLPDGPARSVTGDSEEGRAVLAAHPGLEALLQGAGSVALRWEGEPLLLVPAPADDGPALP